MMIRTPFALAAAAWVMAGTSHADLLLSDSFDVSAAGDDAAGVYALGSIQD